MIWIADGSVDPKESCIYVALLTLSCTQTIFRLPYREKELDCFLPTPIPFYQVPTSAPQSLLGPTAAHSRSLSMHTPTPYNNTSNARGSESGSSDDSDSERPDASGWSASLYNKTASFVYSTPFVAPVLQLLDAKPGERILDLGCGSGEVSLEIEKVVSQRHGGVVVGVDASQSMVRLSFFRYLK